MDALVDDSWVTRELLLDRPNLAQLRWTVEASEGVACWFAERAGPGKVKVVLSCSPELAPALDELIADVEDDFRVHAGD